MSTGSDENDHHDDDDEKANDYGHHRADNDRYRRLVGRSGRRFEMVNSFDI